MARRNAKGPYSNTGPLFHFGTNPTPAKVSAQLDFLGHTFDSEQPRPAPLFNFVEPPPVDQIDLRSMWAASPLFKVEEGA